MCQEPRPFGAFAPLQGETKGRRDCKLEYERPYDSHDDVQLPYEVSAFGRNSTEPPVTPGGTSRCAWRRLGDFPNKHLSSDHCKVKTLMGIKRVCDVPISSDLRDIDSVVSELETQHACPQKTSLS